MYNPALPLTNAFQMHACAAAVHEAQCAKFYDRTDPFQTTDGPMALVARHRYESGVSPSLLAYAGYSRVVVAIAGIQGAADALRVYQGYLSPQTYSDQPGKVNAYAKTWAEAAWPTISPLMTPTVRSWLFIGHSWGSCLATMFANRVQRFDPEANVSICTFGAPRFANRAYLDGLRVQDHVRVHNHADPVPYVIPWFTEAPFFHSIHSPLQILAMNSMCHGGRGIRIQAGQSLAYTDQRTGFDYPLEFNPRGMRDAIVSNVQPHLTDAYVEIMHGYATAPVRLYAHLQVPQGQAKGEDPPRIHGVDADQIAEWPKNGWPEKPQGTDRQPPKKPPLLPLPKWEAPEGRRKGVHVRKEGRLWYVYSGDVQVYKATGKRDAYGWCRSLRQFRKQYRQNPSGVANPDALAEAVAGFLPLSS